MSFINWGNESPEQLRLRRKFEEEQAIFEQRAAAMSAAAAAAATGSGSNRSGSFQCVIDTVEYDEFRLEFISTNEPINYVINWGDGNIHEDSGIGGYYVEYHTYAEPGQYTVTVTLDDKAKLLELNFEGPDDGYSTLIQITGLQKFKNLAEFRADFNSLELVDLSGLPNLVYVDISDCDQIGSGNPSLTKVSLEDCINLEQLRLDGSDFSAGLESSIAGFAKCDKLTYLDLDNCGLSGSIDLSMFSQLDFVDVSGNESISNVIITNEQPIADFLASNCDLGEESVDSILVALSENGKENGQCNLSGGTNSAPSSTGLSAKTTLEGNGWSVNVNTPPPGQVSIAPSTDFNIVGNFTIEMFINFSNLSGNIRPYSFGAYPNAANAVSFESGTMYFWANGGARSFGPFSPNIGQWYHVCIMRSGTNIHLFINGAEIASYVYNDPIPSQGLPLTIGNGNESNSSLNGLISNFRWTSSAVYNTAGFSVPVAPLSDLLDTKLLIFQGQSINSILTDNSGNGHNAFGSGSFSYSTEDPFATTEGSLQVGTV